MPRTRLRSIFWRMWGTVWVLAGWPAAAILMANVGNNARMAVRRTCPGGPFKPSFGLSGYRTVVHYELVYERLQYASRLPSVRWPNAEVYHDLRAVTRCRMTHSTLVCFERVLQSIYHLITPQATNINQVGNRFHLVKTIAQSVTPTLQTINPFANRSENGSEAILRLLRRKHR